MEAFKTKVIMSNLLDLIILILKNFDIYSLTGFCVTLFFYSLLDARFIEHGTGRYPRILSCDMKGVKGKKKLKSK